LEKLKSTETLRFLFQITEKPIPDFFIPLQSLHGAKDGQKVIAQIVSWEKDDKRPKGEVIEVITRDMEGDLAMKEILIQQGFSIQFPENVMEETARIPSAITKDDFAVRRDMREVLTFTIDPEDAKDFDDALSFSRYR